MYAGGDAGGNAEAPKFDGAAETALQTWLRNPRNSGVDVPWVYVRRSIAQGWGVPPWAVDEAPVDEVLLELKLRELEAGSKKK